MKTIGYRDLGDARNIYRAFIKQESGPSFLFNQKRHARIKEALEDIKHTGNIEVVYIKGNKTRHLFYRGL